MPVPSLDPKGDWWLDAARRPLGAYYRVDTRAVTDMHVALHDTGVLYASAVCHVGWDEGALGHHQQVTVLSFRPQQRWGSRRQQCPGALWS